MRGPAWFRAKAGRRDATHASVRDGLRKLGHLVADLAGAAGGIADLAVLAPRSGWGNEPPAWHWLEVKRTKGGKLTPAQVKLRDQWAAKGVEVHVVRSLDEALSVLYPNMRQRIEANARAVHEKAAAVLAQEGV